MLGNSTDYRSETLTALYEASYAVGQEICEPGQDRAYDSAYLPIFAGFWGIIGEVGPFIINSYDLDRVELNRFNWMPWMLWLTTFVTTIFLVNLMIAKMTSTYDKIRRESLYYRALQRCQFIIEFKDERNAPPPFNLVFNVVLIIIPASIKKCIGLRSNAQKGFTVLMGRDATLRLQSREQRLAKGFLRRYLANLEQQSDARVKSIHDELPTLRSLGHRCEALESQLYELKTSQDSAMTMLSDILNVLKDNPRITPPSADSTGSMTLR